MTDRNKLPVKTATGNAVVPTEQSGSLVTRGLEAIRGRQKEPISIPEAEPELLFRDIIALVKLRNQKWAALAADPSRSPEASAAAMRMAVFWRNVLVSSRKAKAIIPSLAADSPEASNLAKLIGRSWLAVKQGKQQPLALTKDQFESLSAGAQDDAKRILRQQEVHKHFDYPSYAEAIELWRKAKK